MAEKPSQTNAFSIQLQDVSFRWKGNDVETLQAVNLNIKQGEQVFIRGESGCGKSTLLSLLTGMHPPTQGKICLSDINMNQLSSFQRDRFRADHIGYIFQQLNLLPHLSVIENVLLPCRFSRVRRKRLSDSPSQTAYQLLKNLNLSVKQIHQSVDKLSVGQQQRVAAARALIGQPPFIFADEPTSALDENNRQDFLEQLMQQAQKNRTTLVFVSHDPRLESQFERVIDFNAINKIG